MTETMTIPLNKLTLWDGNVRRTGVTDGIPELAASISAHGLLQSLVVRKGKRGKFEIVAGQRRFLALQSLLKERTIANDFAVPYSYYRRRHRSVLDLSRLGAALRAKRSPGVGVS